MVVADLHVHTPNSDGVLTLDSIPQAAREAGVEAVAITDHDRLHPALDAPVVERDGVTVVHGIELKVQAGDQRVDLLGYGARRTDALEAEVDRLQRDRVERGRHIIENVEAHLGHSIPVEPERGLGRPDVARAVVESDPDYETMDAVFADLIADGGPCFVAREVTDYREGLALLREACGVVGLAHPLRYDDPASALALTADLDAVELHYPYGDDRDLAPVRAAINERDLLVTGGSDAHDRTLGVAGLDRAEYDRVRAALD
jgi:predicted metal-dependent phosphoesterase TrpH